MKKLLYILLLLYSVSTTAATVNLSWDASTSNQSDIGGYRIYVGNKSGTYIDYFDVGNVLNYTLYPLDNNTLYYFAATTLPSTNSNLPESVYSNEVFLTTPDATLIVNFKASVVSGKAPLIINFTSILNGKATCRWGFGDGYSSSVCNPVHKYSRPGSYTVKLTATNSLGSVICRKYRYIRVF